MMATAVTSRRR